MKVKSINMEYDNFQVLFVQNPNEDNNVVFEVGDAGYENFESSFLCEFSNVEELEDFINRLTELKKLFNNEQ